MKLKIYIIKKNIIYIWEKVYNCIFFRCIRSSLIYNMLKIFLCIIFFVWCIFKILPHQADIFLESDGVNYFAFYSNSYDNNNIKFEDIGGVVVELMSDNNLSLNLRNVSINIDNKIYNGDYEIKIVCSGEDFISRQIIFEPAYNCFFNLYMESLADLKFRFFEETFENPYQTDFICTYANFHIQYPFKISFSPSVDEYISAYLVGEDREIPFESCVIDGYIKYEEWPMIDLCFYGGEYAITPTYTDQTKSMVSLLSVDNVDMNCTGSFYFSYAPDSKEYKLRWQDLDLHSKSGEIKCTFMQDIKRNMRKIILTGR